MEAFGRMRASQGKRAGRQRNAQPDRAAGGDGQPSGIALVPLVFGYVNYAAAASRPPAPSPSRKRRALPPAGAAAACSAAPASRITARARPDAALLDHLRWLMSAEAQTGFIPAHDGQPSARAAWQSADVNNRWGGFYSATARHVRSVPGCARVSTATSPSRRRLCDRPRGVRDGSPPTATLPKMRTPGAAAPRRRPANGKDHDRKSPFRRHRPRFQPSAAGAVLHAAAGRHGRQRDQGRTAGTGRPVPHDDLQQPMGRRRAKARISSPGTATSARSPSTSRRRRPRQILYSIAEKADVVVQNFRPGVMASSASATRTSARSTRASSTARARAMARAGRI